MGSSSPKTVVDEPQFDHTVVDQLCKEAYAAGVGDTSVQYQTILESQWRVDTVVGLGGCAMTFLLSYAYFTSRMADLDAQALQAVETERSHVMQMQQESGQLKAQLEKLSKDNTDLQRVVDRSAKLIRRMSRRHRRLFNSFTRVRNQSTSLLSEVGVLNKSLGKMNQRLTLLQCGGGLALGYITAVSIAAFMTSSSGVDRSVSRSQNASGNNNIDAGGRVETVNSE